MQVLLMGRACKHKVKTMNHVTNVWYWEGCGCNAGPDAPPSNWTWFTSEYRSRPPRSGRWGR